MVLREVVVVEVVVVLGVVVVVVDLVVEVVVVVVPLGVDRPATRYTKYTTAKHLASRRGLCSVLNSTYNQNSLGCILSL